MTGMTDEISFVSEALQKLHSHCIETLGKPPRRFLMGVDEWVKFSTEIFPQHTHEFLEIPIEITDGEGIACSVGAGEPLLRLC